MDTIVAFHFLRPAFLLLLLPVVFIAWRQLKRQRAQALWQKHFAPTFLDVLTSGQSSPKHKFSHALLPILLALMVVALAGPSWNKQQVSLHSNKAPLVIVLDLSPSMLVEDIKPSRIQRARLKILDLLAERPDGLTALIVYGADAHVVTPLTDDIKTIKSMLPSLSPTLMPAAGSNIEAALEQAELLLQNTQNNSSDAQVLILSDGIDASALASLKNIKKTSLNDFIIWSIGTENGGPIPNGQGSFVRNNDGSIVVAGLNHQQFQDAAAALGAIYVPFSTSSLDINTLKNLVLHSSHDSDGEHKRDVDLWQDNGPWVLLPALLLFILLFRRGQLLIALFTLPMLLITSAVTAPNATASSLDKFWFSKDQRAERAFDQQDYEKASGLFNNKDWQAAAEYKQGNYEAAANYWQQQSGAEAQYNLANSLALAGKIDEAIAAYDRALNEQPDFQQAQHNKALLEQLKQQQEQQQQQQQQSDQGGDSQQPQDGNQQQQSQQGSEQNSNDNNQAGQNQNEQNQNEQPQQADQQQKQQNPPEQNQAGGDNQQQADNQDNAEQQQAATDAADKNTDSDQQANNASTGDKGERQPEDNQALNEHYQQDQAEQDKAQQAKAETNEQQALEKQIQQQQKAQQDTNTAEASARAETQYLRPSEEQQELEQWLRKVPDDPGTLLRNKFEDQYRQKNMQRRAQPRSAPDETQQRW
ncbi:vWA domain-containing protein [Agaribacterium haliotis]|uniref:vWA domain-containing protein n=1 Tax=Agaribacterium haliotis TaxID=2013869 RepID=UPI000BB53C8E|nr:VWA domain-containing protein [Agaribacterium haliotis]